MSDIPSPPPPPPPATPPPPPPPVVEDPSGRISPPMPSAEDAKIGFFSRFSDRLNPILVREVHQALNGKAFLITASLALMAIILIAMITAAQQDVDPRRGAETFSIALMVLAPILLFIVPFQAFLSMRGEVRGGTVEHLLMSRLGPAAIVRGKLMAATVQFVIYLAIFSPLIGLTFLLRGVDVALIATMLALSFVYALSASAMGIACGALSRWPSVFKLIPFAIMLIGGLWFTGLAMALIESEIWEIRRMIVGDHTGRFLAIMLVPAGVFIVLCSMVGSAVMAHPYENRSSKFRLFAIAWVLIAAIWIYLDWRSYIMTPSMGMGYPPERLGEMLFYTSAVSALVLFLFAFFASTESPELSPRVRARVPKSPVLALLVAPLLPGAGRGLLFTILLAFLSMATYAIVPAIAGQPKPPSLWTSQPDLALVSWLEVFLYCGVACFVRGFMNEQASRSWIARAVFPVLLIISAILPVLLEIVSGGRGQFRWTPLSVFDPVRTLTSFERRYMTHDVLSFTLGLACFLLLLNLPAMVRGVREVLDASAARRAREAGTDQEPDPAPPTTEEVPEAPLAS